MFCDFPTETDLPPLPLWCYKPPANFHKKKRNSHCNYVETSSFACCDKYLKSYCVKDNLSKFTVATRSFCAMENI